MKTKVSFAFALVLFFIAGQVSVFADRKAVDDYLKSYEAFVVEYENLAKKPAITAMDMLPLSQKSLDFSQKTQAVQKDTSWTVQDTIKLAALSERLNKAADAVNKKLS
jgi:hypothetical protein